MGERFLVRTMGGPHHGETRIADSDGLGGWTWPLPDVLKYDAEGQYVKVSESGLLGPPPEGLNVLRGAVYEWTLISTASPAKTGSTDVIKRRLLDTFCCAGGMTRGYQQAGFYVVGVDNQPQPRYCGEEFIQADALDVLADRGFLANFDAISASPPCQAYSELSNCRPGLAATYPELIDAVLDLLRRQNRPWVIENVAGSNLPTQDSLFGQYGLLLCGRMVGLDLYRHRKFQTSFPIMQPHHPRHLIPASKAGHWQPGTIISVAGNCAPIAESRKAMGIDWMRRAELAEAVPPAYAAYIGRRLTVVVEAAA